MKLGEIVLEEASVIIPTELAIASGHISAKNATRRNLFRGVRYIKVVEQEPCYVTLLRQPLNMIAHTSSLVSYSDQKT